MEAQLVHKTPPPLCIPATRIWLYSVRLDLTWKHVPKWYACWLCCVYTHSGDKYALLATSRGLGAMYARSANYKMHTFPVHVTSLLLIIRAGNPCEISTKLLPKVSTWKRRT